MSGRGETGAVLVLGAGELGMAVLEPLIPRASGLGLSVDVLVRRVHDPALERVRALGAGPVQGDVALASGEELAALFGRYDTVLSCVGFAAGPGTQTKLARAALASGVRRYFPWQFGVDYDVIGRGSPQPLFDEQLHVREILRAQRDVRWVIVSVGMFTSFLFDPSFGVVDLERGLVCALGGWDNAVTVTAPSDIGRLTTDIVLARPEFADEVVHVAGDTISYGALADLVEQELGGPVERRTWTVPALMDSLSRDPDDVMTRYRAVFASGRGVSWDKGMTFNGRRGLPVSTARDWLREHLRKRDRGSD